MLITPQHTRLGHDELSFTNPLRNSQLVKLLESSPEIIKFMNEPAATNGGRRTSTPQTKREICRNFLCNRCTWGHRCHFIHSPRDDNATNSGPVSTVDERRICRSFLYNLCDLGDSCPHTHNAHNAHNDNRAICRNFLQGRCAFGNGCRHKHLSRVDNIVPAEPVSTVKENEVSASLAGVANPTLADNSILSLDADRYYQSVQHCVYFTDDSDVINVKMPTTYPRRSTKSRRRTLNQVQNVREPDICTIIFDPSIVDFPSDDSYVVNFRTSRRQVPECINNEQSLEQWDPGIHFGSKIKSGDSQSSDTSLDSHSDLISTLSSRSSVCQAESVTTVDEQKSQDKLLDVGLDNFGRLKHLDAKKVRVNGIHPAKNHRPSNRDDSSRNLLTSNVDRKDGIQNPEQRQNAHLESKFVPQKPIESSPHPVESSANLTVNILNHSKVKFGPGFQVLDVTTGFESRWIFMSNIPSTVSANAVSRVLTPFGTVIDSQFVECSGTLKTVRAQFADHSEAVQATTALNGAQLFNQTVNVRLAIGNARNANGSLKDTSVVVEWEAPGRVAYAGYSSLPEAEAAIARARTSFINGKVYQGLPAIGAFNVRFRGLPPNADAQYVENFGQPETVMLERPNYISLDRAIGCIRNMLADLGRLTFEMVPPPYQDGMVHAWATFPSPQLAKAAADHLHGLRPLFIGKGYIWAYHMKTASYNLSKDNFDKIEADVNHLRDSCWPRFGDGTFIRIHRKSQSMDPNLPIRITLSGENLRDLGRLKSEFEDILRGEIVRLNGKAAWDSYFSQIAGKAYLDDIERQYRPVSIRTDPNRRLIFLFGPIKERRVVREAIVRKLMALNRQKVRDIPLEGGTIGYFMSIDLMMLQQRFGPDNVALNLARRILSVRGNDDAFVSAQQAVKRAEEQGHQKRRREIQECPVCFNDAVSPVTLECGHTWCKACLVDYIVAATDNKLFPLTCLGMEASCPQLLSITLSYNILPASDFDAVAHASFLAYVQSRPNEFYYCPTPDCRQIYRTAPENAILQCPECLIRVCPKCRVEYHDGIECSGPAGSSEQLFKEWFKSHDVKNCPGCKAPIERAEGCNHMTCTRCLTHICWVCMATFPKGEGIYRHMRREHGGIGL